MNKVILMGRLTRDPEIRYGQGDGTAVGRYTLAVDRMFKRDGQPEADFISCVTFGKSAEFAEKYLHKGMKIAITGRIQTGSYTNRDGNKVYTTDVIVESHEFAESKSGGNNGGQGQNNGGQGSNQNGGQGYSQNSQNSGYNNGYNGGSAYPPAGDGFMNIPDGIDEELPFN